MSGDDTTKEYSSGLVASARIGIILVLDSQTETKSLNDLGENSTQDTVPFTTISAMWLEVVPEAAPK